MTADELNAIRARLDAATPGPWFARPNDLIGGWCVRTVDTPPSEGPGEVADFIRETDARLIAAAPADIAALLAELETLRQTLDATEEERDQWQESSLDRRQALSDAEATLTGVYFALRPEGGVNGWRPSRGVDTLIDLALTVREDAEDAEKGAAACDQIVALLDGIPVEAPCPEAARVAALLAEIERLRAEVHELRLMVEEAARAENANAEDAKRERAAVVAWLDAREEALNAEAEAAQIEGFRTWASTCASEAAFVADCIERGEHRREGGR